MKWVVAMAVAWFAAPTGGLAQEIDFKETRVREWTDSSGQNGLSARLLSLNSKQDVVSLLHDDDTAIEIPLSDLSGYM